MRRARRAIGRRAMSPVDWLLSLPPFPTARPLLFAAVPALVTRPR